MSGEGDGVSWCRSLLACVRASADASKISGVLTDEDLIDFPFTSGELLLAEEELVAECARASGGSADRGRDVLFADVGLDLDEVGEAVQEMLGRRPAADVALDAFLLGFRLARGK